MLRLNFLKIIDLLYLVRINGDITLKFCPNCGEKIEDKQLYCECCGIDLKKKISKENNYIKENSKSNEDEIIIIQDENEIQEDLKKAIEYKNDGDHEKALSYYSIYLSSNPNDGQAWSDKGFVLSMLGKYEDAIKCFDKALELNCKIPKLVYINKGNCLINLDKYKEAILSLNSALEIDPYISHAWHSKGIAYMNLRMLDRALSCFEKTLNIDPMHEEALINKNELLELIKKEKEA